MDACEGEGAKLIIIMNEIESLQVRNAIKAAGIQTCPMNGLQKTLSNGIVTWKWWNGENLSYFGWEPGRPNNYYGNENCVCFWTGAVTQYKFDDVDCSWRNSFVCQKII
ncbi:hypothetical protein ACJMK2_001710 [Sinanodonta woodiana]|uniref:C-type lectin domain-containing protein n=1 Tax=Sinanodonta woodiana TaxID=1069815 RepID=A0ABD3XUW7_SINWO